MNGGSAGALEADLVVDIPAANESDYLGGQFIGIVESRGHLSPRQPWEGA